MGNAALYSRPFHPVNRLVASGSNFIAESAVVKNATFSSRQDLSIRMILEDEEKENQRKREKWGHQKKGGGGGGEEDGDKSHTTSSGDTHGGGGENLKERYFPKKRIQR